MNIVVLASGSGGNATYIETENTKILIDCGISLRQIKQRLQIRGIELVNIDYLLITHEHTDHSKEINRVLANTSAKLILNKQTFQGLHKSIRDNVLDSEIEYVSAYNNKKLGDIDLIPISTSHDAANSLGYVLLHQGKKVVYATDTGYLPEKNIPFMENPDVLIFESNYEPEMLIGSKRPWFLKERILGAKGHLSNQESALLSKKIIGADTKYVIYAHLSKECNTPEAVESSLREIFPEIYNMVEVSCAHQDIPTKIFHI